MRARCLTVEVLKVQIEAQFITDNAKSHSFPNRMIYRKNPRKQRSILPFQARTSQDQPLCRCRNMSSRRIWSTS